MVLKTKAGITRKQKIAEHKKSGCLFAKIVQYLLALKTKTEITVCRRKRIIRNQVIYPSVDGTEDKSWDNKEAEKGKHPKSGYLSAKIVQYLMALKTKVGKQGRGRQRSIRNQVI